MKKISFYIVAVLSALLFVSCSSSSKVDWVIVTDTAFRPFEYFDDNDTFTGIDVDILNAIAKNQGFTFELRPLGWNASIEACRSGNADGMIAGATINEERKANGWIFSDGYFDSSLCIASSKDAFVNDFKDLSHKIVAVKKGTMSEQYAIELKAKYNFSISVFADSLEMYQDVLDGKSFACIEDTPIMAENIKAGLVDLNIAIKSDKSFSYGFVVFDEKQRPLIDKFNAGLANIKANGTYQKIIDKYIK